MCYLPCISGMFTIPYMEVVNICMCRQYTQAARRPIVDAVASAQPCVDMCLCVCVCVCVVSVCRKCVTCPLPTPPVHT